ncbi:MAG: hypothetical protein KF893_14910 [Caldilineaceae bacterium]|nr:hypothetical protein [Caldilineaceae bacterium]
MFGWLRCPRPLSAQQKEILRLVHSGWTLKSHRYLDGQKIYRLHALNGEVIDLRDSVVEPLIARGFFQSNQKFPAATLLFTPQGRVLAMQEARDWGSGTGN